MADEARALVAGGQLDEAIAQFDAHLELEPKDVQAWAELVRVLVTAGRTDEAVKLAEDLDPSTPLVVLAHGEALAAAGDLDESLVVLAKARDWYLHELRNNYGAEYARIGFDEASRLHDDIYARLHGREQVAVEAAREGKLDAHAGVNYRLLGDSLMVGSTHQPERLHLPSLDEQTDLHDDLSAVEQHTAAGFVLFGTILLREGLAADAREAFERATELDGTSFAAFRGLGAALELAKEHWTASANLLDEPDWRDWREFASVVPDLPNLTSTERKIVTCSIAPLRHALPALAADDAVIRIMPLDVRATDHPEFTEREAHRFEDDSRTMSALSGVAGETLALVRLDELLDIGPTDGWVFAHEFAHLAHHRLRDDVRDEIVEWFEEAVAAGYASTSYAQTNEFEFFAVQYQDYVRRRHSGGDDGTDDGIGVREGMFALIDRLARTPDAFAPAARRK